MNKKPAKPVSITLPAKVWRDLEWIAGYGAGAILHDRANANSSMAFNGEIAVDALHGALAKTEEAAEIE